MTRGLHVFSIAKPARDSLVGRDEDEVRALARARRSRGLGWPRVWMATTAAVLLGALIQDVSAAPQLNRVSGGDCFLAPGTVSSLVTDLTGAGIPGRSPGTPEIAFVVVYSLNHDNDGQPVIVSGTNGFTGPVICVNDAVTGIAPTTQTTPIPTGGGSVTTLDAEDAFILRYRVNGVTEKVLCHSTNENTDCFRFSP